MSAHTPGPWVVKYSADFGIPLIEPDHARADDPIIAKCYSGETDARLIAAAPCLLSELKACEAVLTSMHQRFGFAAGSLELLEGVRATIAKAEGKT